MTTTAAVEASTTRSRRVIEITLPAESYVVPYARHFTVDVLRHWGLDHLVDVAEVLTAELATNAINVSDADASEENVVRVQLNADAERLFVVVWDRDARPPVVQKPAADAESGRGLTLVELLSDQWGHRPSKRGGKIVWAEVRTGIRLHREPDTGGPPTEAGFPVRVPRSIPPGPMFALTVDLVTLERFLAGLKAWG